MVEQLVEPHFAITSASKREIPPATLTLFQRWLPARRIELCLLRVGAQDTLVRLSRDSNVDWRRLKGRTVLDPVPRLADDGCWLAARAAIAVRGAWDFVIAVEVVDVGRDFGDGIVISLSGFVGYELIDLFYDPC